MNMNNKIGNNKFGNHIDSLIILTQMS